MAPLTKSNQVPSFGEEIEDCSSPNSLEIPMILSSSLSVILNCNDWGISEGKTKPLL
jgi:hypothetical protein